MFKPKPKSSVTFIRNAILTLLAILVLAVFSALILRRTAREVTAPDKQDNLLDPIANLIEFSADEYDAWNGTYHKGNYTILLYRTHFDEIEMEIQEEDSGKRATYSMTLQSADELSFFQEYDNFFSNAEISVTVSKTKDGISLQASTSDTKSSINALSGDYNKEIFTPSGWDGTYLKGAIFVTLAEIGEGKLLFSITSKGYIALATDVTNYSDAEATYEWKFGGEGTRISFVKASDGIEIRANSDFYDFYNKISGSYPKYYG